MVNRNRNHLIGVYSLSTLIFIVIHYSLDLEFFSFLHQFIPFLKNLSFALAISSIILVIRTILDKLIIKKTGKKGDEYNLLRITKLISTILILFVAISVVFQKPYSFLAGLGVASLVLGFALQAPITSFIAWLYVVFRQPFKVGDRIQINEHKGDVVEINYIDTILYEVSGDYIGNDHQSGRLVHFPNSLILTDKVINYSGLLKPFIWNETAIQIAYTSDLDFVEDCLIEATMKDFKKIYPAEANLNQKKWKPVVYFRVNQYAWMEAVISYPVEPEDTTGRRNRILRAALPLLNTKPEKVQFPEGTHR